MNIQKFFEALAEIMAARENVVITVKSVKKAHGEENTAGNAERHLEQKTA